MSEDGYRLEKDLLGPKRVPVDAYYGVQTVRALENFAISGVPISHYPNLIRALGMVKLAAARTNHEFGDLSAEVMGGIDAACQALIEGRHHDQFPLDCFQGGAGTSTNMNANEVIANLALEHMGHVKGDYQHCDPHNDVNRCQSTNDAYPSALHVSLALTNRELLEELRALVASFRRKGRDFQRILKVGRTQLQDAVPMTLGQEFNAWAASLENEISALDQVETVLHAVNMGGTAIGTGLNAPKGFAAKCANLLGEISGLPIRSAADLVEATQDTQAFVLYSSCLKSLAIKLSKICNDLRLLSSGPRAGIGEISLPAMQPGSSIMPGKVNPVIPEVVNQVCYRAIGNDLTVTLAAEAGQLQLNVMEPVIALCVLETQALFLRASETLRLHCVDGILANRDRCRELVERCIGIVTALNPILGYEVATELATEALASGRGIVELVREKELLSERELLSILDPDKMIGSKTRRL